MEETAKRAPTILNPNPGITEEDKAALMEAGDYSFAHNDGNQKLFSPKGLGLISWASPWSMANLFRYAHAASTVVKAASAQDCYKMCRVLDVGCSAATFGVFWRVGYAAAMKPTIDYIGYEIDDAKIKEGRENTEPKTERARRWAKLEKHDLVLEKLTDHLPEGWVPNVIIAQEIIEHIGEPAAIRFLKEAYALLPSGGTMVVSTPAPRKEDGVHWVWGESHAYEFSRAELKALVEDVGFNVVHEAGWFSQGSDRKGMSPELKKLYKDLAVASPAIAASVIGFLNPEHATCVTLTLEKP